MTAQAPAGGVVRSHVIVGDPDEVVAALARASDDGRLTGLGQVVELPDGRVQVTASLWGSPGQTSRGQWLWRLLAGVLVAAACAGLVWLLIVAVAALVAAVTSAVAAVVSWLSAHLALIVFGGLVLLLVCSAGSRCRGLHCGGCRR